MVLYKAMNIVYIFILHIFLFIYSMSYIVL